MRELVTEWSQSRFRVLVGHSIPLFSMGIFATLAEHREYDVQRTDDLLSAGNISSFGPHIVCTDYRCGMSLLGDNRLRQSTRVAIFTRIQGVEETRSALAAGAAGYVLMNSSLEQVASCVAAIRRGLRYVSPSMLDRLKEVVMQPRLSPRQLDVLRLMYAGMTNKQIGASLGVAEPTVKTHVAAVMSKLDAVNRTQAIVRAAELQVLKDTSIRTSAEYSEPNEAHPRAPFQPSHQTGPVVERGRECGSPPKQHREAALIHLESTE